MQAASRIVRRPSLAAILLTVVLPASARGECPAPIEKAQRLILVAAPSMNAVSAMLRRFERSPAGDWHEVGAATPAVVGLAGLAWGLGEEGRGAPGKREGDRRTPAGLFRLGAPFGRAASRQPGYLRLESGRQICVDDPTSPDYGRIVTRAEAPAAQGEDMGRIPLYRRGFVIDYPIDASRHGGSCIFLHVWRGPTQGTVGCVAAAEPTVAALQAWAKPGDAIAILPEPEAAPLRACLGAR